MEVNELDKDKSDKATFARRVVIENVKPEIQCGRFPIKRTIGEPVEVTADVYGDGHDIVHAVLLHRPLCQQDWEEVPMQPLVNDRWQAKFIVAAEGIHLYTLQGWVDPFQSWSRDFSKKLEAGQDISVDLLTGVNLVEAAAKRASGEDAQRLATRANEALRLQKQNLKAAAESLSNVDLTRLMMLYADRSQATIYNKELRWLLIVKEPGLARGTRCFRDRAEQGPSMEPSGTVRRGSSTSLAWDLMFSIFLLFIP